jgi:hypothetical protein
VANIFAIRISAIDAATKTIKAISKSLAGITKPANVSIKALRSLGQVGSHSLTMLSKGLRDVANVGGTASRVLEWLTLPGAATGVVALANQFGNFAFGLNMSSKMLDVNQQNLTKWHYAAKLAGVSAETFDQAWGQGSMAVRAAAYGLDPVMLGRLGNAGIKIETDPITHQVKDYEKVKRQMLAASAQMPVQGAADFLGIAHMGDLLPLVIQNTYDLDREGAGRKGWLQSDADLARGVKSKQNIEAMKASMEGLANTIGSRLVPIVEPLVNGFANWLDDHRVDIAKQLATAVGKIADWLKTIDWQKLRSDVIDAWNAIGGLKTVVGSLLALKFAGPIADVMRLAAALSQLGAFFVLNPIGLVIAAIATLAFGTYELVKHWDDVKQWWHHLWESMSDDTKTNVDKINESKKSLDKNENYNIFDVFTDRVGLAMDRMNHANAGSSGLTKHVVEELMRDGLKSSSAIGYAANLFQESKYDPDAGKGTPHYGIAQWDATRQARYKQWYGRDIHGSSLEEQLAFAARELQEGDPQTQLGGRTLGLLNDPQAAAMVIAEQVERPGNMNQEKKIRSKNAELIQRALGPNFGAGLEVPAAAAPPAADQAAPAAGADAYGSRVSAMQQAAPTLMVHVHNALPGTTVHATANGQPMPSRVAVSTDVLYGAMP